MMRNSRPRRPWRCRSSSAAAVVLAVGGVLSSPPTLDPAVYVEPSDAEQWGDGSATGPPFAEPRLAAEELSQESFDKMILDGRVSVVEGIGRDWPMSKWDCDYFRSDPVFSQAQMSQQYAAGADSGFVDFKSDWLEKGTSSGAKDKDAPQVAPFYWGIKDVQYPDAHRSATWKKSMLKKVQEHVRLPKFMNEGNQASFYTTPEFWFAAAGAGAKAHMDTHVQATVSFQLAGTKRWRLKAMDARKAPFLTMIYKDGDVYEEATPWAPHFNLTLRPGEALFFPPGFIHETLNLDNEGSSCAASVTFQFSRPMSTRFYRRFLPRVRRTADIHEAWPLLAEWACLFSRQPKAGLPYEEARTQALGRTGIGRAFTEADKDGDDVLSPGELTARFREQAQDLLGFHDLDEDGTIARAEFAEVFGLWASTVKAALEGTPKKWRKYQLDDMVGDFNIEDLPGKLTKKMLQVSRQMESSTSSSGHIPSAEL